MRPFAPSTLDQKEKSMTVKFALLGAGRIGKVHAKAITANPDAKLVAVADAMPAAAKELAAKYGCQVRTIDEIEAAKDIDAVVICTPTDTHADLIEQLREGRQGDLLREADRSDARARQAVPGGGARRPRRKLMVGFNRRFDPHFAAVRRRSTTARSARSRWCTITSRDPGAPPPDYIKRVGRHLPRHDDP